MNFFPSFVHSILHLFPYELYVLCVLISTSILTPKSTTETTTITTNFENTVTVLFYFANAKYEKKTLYDEKKNNKQTWICCCVVDENFYCIRFIFTAGVYNLIYYVRLTHRYMRMRLRECACKCHSAFMVSIWQHWHLTHLTKMYGDSSQCWTTDYGRIFLLCFEFISDLNGIWIFVQFYVTFDWCCWLEQVNVVLIEAMKCWWENDLRELNVIICD